MNSSETKTIKKWSFNRGKMNLNFEIDIEVRKDMLDFRGLLKQALDALDEEIAGEKSQKPSILSRIWQQLTH